MDAELSRLERHVEQLISLCEGLKADNRELRTRLAKFEADNHALADKVKFATTQFEALLEKLPQP
jgi:cell division protein ZapB